MLLNPSRQKHFLFVAIISKKGTIFISLIFFSFKSLFELFSFKGPWWHPVITPSIYLIIS